MKKIILLLLLWKGFASHAQTIVGQPHWSADGRKIVYVVEIDGNYEIYLIDKDGLENRRLTFTDALESNPIFSPDGSKILYESRGEEHTQICIMNNDGSGRQNISNSNGNDLEPSWSPSGNKIAFRSLRDGTSQIYIMNADGSDCTRASDLNYNNSAAVWSPDETKLACKSIKLPESKNSLLDLVNGTATILDLDYRRQYDCDRFSLDSKKIIFHQSLQTMISSSNGIQVPNDVFFVYDIERKTFSALKKGVNDLGSGDSVEIAVHKNEKRDNSPERGQGEFSAVNNLILFHDGKNIYTMKANGSNVQNLTKSKF